METIQAGFTIERDVEGIRDLALSLTDEESGEIIKSKGDYSERQGVYGLPVTETHLTKSIPVCHSHRCIFYKNTIAGGGGKIYAPFGKYLCTLCILYQFLDIWSKSESVLGSPKGDLGPLGDPFCKWGPLLVPFL